MSIQVPFFRPDIGQNEVDYLLKAIKSGWLTTGPLTKEFEDEFATYIGGDVEAIAVNSATAALHLGLEAMGVEAGDEVICPTLTFTATAEVVRYLGADPVFVDVDPVKFTIRPEDIEAVITPKTKVIMPVHFAGLTCDVDGIRRVASKYNLKVLDDAAHALPVDGSTGRIGATGFDATAFSFYANKTITTGEGGMLVSKNPELIARARIMRLHGIDRDVFNRFTDMRASWRYDVVAPGYKYNMTDVAAALGLGQLPRADNFALSRRKLAMKYNEALSDLPVILPFTPSNANTHCWHLYIIRLRQDAQIQRDDLMQKLKDRGVGCSVHYMPLHQMTYWRERYDLDSAKFPNANTIFESCISLPLFPSMTESEQVYVIEQLSDLLKV